MKTKLEHWDSNSELDLFVKMAALPLAFLGLLIVVSFSFSHYFEANTKGQLSTIAYQKSQIKTITPSSLAGR